MSAPINNASPNSSINYQNVNLNPTSSASTSPITHLNFYVHLQRVFLNMPVMPQQRPIPAPNYSHLRPEDFEYDVLDSDNEMEPDTETSDEDSFQDLEILPDVSYDETSQ